MLHVAPSWSPEAITVPAIMEKKSNVLTEGVDDQARIPSEIVDTFCRRGLRVFVFWSGSQQLLRFCDFGNHFCRRRFFFSFQKSFLLLVYVGVTHSIALHTRNSFIWWSQVRFGIENDPHLLLSSEKSHCSQVVNCADVFLGKGMEVFRA